MFKKFRAQKENSLDGLFDYGTIKIVVFAILTIAASVLIMGGISYMIAENAVVKNVQTKELAYAAQTIAAKIDGRIDRAKETSMMLASDPHLIRWVQDGERDEDLGRMILEKISGVAGGYDYSNSFVVSAVTNHYWDEKGKIIDTMSPSDPDDSWFFNLMASQKLLSIELDYNKERKDTFVFVDAVMWDAKKPIAVTGVGLNLKEIAAEVQTYKVGDKSNMWLVDQMGTIYLAEDVEHINRNISDFLPAAVAKRIVADEGRTGEGPGVLDYTNQTRERFDLVYEPIKSTDWKLVYQVPRKESIAIVSSIKVNTAIASIIIILLIMFIFYWVSGRMADPYQRALKLSSELERKVAERTQELNEQNIKIMDSIEYAKMIQEAILPNGQILDNLFREHFILWKPRDTVGGDFYWVKRMEKGFVLLVGDCTGHGVPGALMTMAVNSILNHIVDETCCANPSFILQELHKVIKQTLHQGENGKSVRDGLEAAVLYVADDKNMVFAGAGISMYMRKNDHISILKGDNKSIGYRSSVDRYQFANHTIEVHGDEEFYVTTDGYVDQNGGEKDFSFGKKRFASLIESCFGQEMTRQKNIFEEELQRYMGDEPQRDDITVFAFKPLRDVI